MPYPKHQPVDEEEMLKPATEEEMNFARYAGHHTICETLREIWRASEDEEVKMKCRLAVSMAKAMVEKLKSYRSIVGQETAHQVERQVDRRFCYKPAPQEPTEEV